MQLEIPIRCPVHRQLETGWGNCDGEIELVETVHTNHVPFYVGRCVQCDARVRFIITPLIIETISNPLVGVKVNSAIEN